MRIKVLDTLELSSEVSVITLGKDELGNEVVETLYLNVMDDTNLTSIALAGENDEPIGVISAADYSTAESITEAGVYMADVAGFSKIKMTVTGTCTVRVKGLA